MKKAGLCDYGTVEDYDAPKGRAAVGGIYRLSMKQRNVNFRLNSAQGAMKWIKVKGAEIIVYALMLGGETFSAAAL